MKRLIIAISLLLSFLFLPSLSFASTWNDVVAWVNANPAPSGCFYFTMKTSGGGFQVWKRCNPNTISYTKKIAETPSAQTGTNIPQYGCDGSGNTIYRSGAYYVATGGREDNLYCDGHIVQGTTAPYTGNPDAWPRVQTLPCYYTHTAVYNCAVSDVLVNDWPVITDNCAYSTIQPMSVSVLGWGNNATLYVLHYQDIGMSNNCGQCIPDGTIPYNYAGSGSYPANNTVGTDGTVWCYFADVTGDPALPDTYTPSSNGGGATGNTGTSQGGSTETITTTSTVGGSTETVTTSTSSTGNTSTTTTTVQGCIDNNGDGISDVSGAVCSGSTTTSTSTDSVPVAPTSNVDPVTGGEYYDTSLDTPVQEDWQSLITGFISSNPFASIITGSGVQLSGATCSVTANIWGRDVTFSFCDLSSYLDMFGYLFLGLCGLRSIFLAFGAD